MQDHACLHNKQQPVLWKTTFCRPVSNLLQYKRLPFGNQKAVFYQIENHHLRKKSKILKIPTFVETILRTATTISFLPSLYEAMLFSIDPN